MILPPNHTASRVVVGCFCVSIVNSVSPEVLDDEHQLVNKFTQLCGNLNHNGWTMRCSQLELHGCTLREVCVKIKRIGQLEDRPFNCRVGELMVLDVASLQVPPDRIQGVCIDDVVWLRGAGTSLLNATLRWDYPGNLVRHFKVYWRQLRGPHPSIPPGQLVLVGRSYSNLFRVTELRVPEPPGLLELVVEPVIKMGFPVPESHWGRRSFSYTKDSSK